MSLALIGLLLAGVAAYAAPLLLAALGGLASERSGVINIGLEGKMLGAACAAAIAGLWLNNIWAAILAAILMATLLSLLHAWLTQVFQIDQVISGMGINALAIGGTGYLSEAVPILQSGGTLPRFPEPLFWGLALFGALGFALFLARTKGGLRLLAVGNNPDKSRLMGLDPVKIRFKALIATGVFCGLAGALIAGTAGGFAKDMTAGRGYIALAALVLAGWRPIPALLACLGFSLLTNLNILFQGSPILGVTLPGEFWQAVPYLATLLALCLVVQSNRAPGGLGKP